MKFQITLTSDSPKVLLHSCPDGCPLVYDAFGVAKILERLAHQIRSGELNHNGVDQPIFDGRANQVGFITVEK